MNKRQRDQYMMLESVVGHFNGNEAIWSSNVLIAQAKATLTDLRDQIEAASAKQSCKSVGMTMDKAILRKELEGKALFVSKAICAYVYLNSGQKQLYERVYIAKSSLSKLRGSDLLYYVERLSEAAQEVLENLEPYGITQATIAALTAARTAFYDIMELPKEIMDNCKEAAAIVADLLRQAIALLNLSMDNLIEMLREADPQFENIYYSCRKIHRSGTRTRSLEITTLNAADSTPLADAQIEIIDHHIKRKSSEKGQNRVRNLKQGYYTLSVVRPNFVSQTISFSIVNHKTTKLVIEMEEEGSEGQRDKSAEMLRNLEP